MAPMTTPFVRCNGCGKRGYYTKRAAKHVRRLHYEANLSVYRCTVNPDFWHIGHLPGKVVDGRVDRHDLGTSAMRNL